MKKKSDSPDKPNCTYWWYIHLIEGRDKIVGYSKWVNQAEAIDKENCLMSKIEMLHRNGYFEKCHKIEIFKRVGALPSVSNDPLILTILPREYKIPERYVNWYNENGFRILTFLKNFYELINEGKQVVYLRPLPSKKSKDELFDLSKLAFKRLQDLSDYVFKLLNDGHPHTEVEHFYRKAQAKFFPNI